MSLVSGVGGICEGADLLVRNDLKNRLQGTWAF